LPLSGARFDAPSAALAVASAKRTFNCRVRSFAHRPETITMPSFIFGFAHLLMYTTIVRINGVAEQ